MLTMLKYIFDYSMFTSVLKLYINYIFISFLIEKTVSKIEKRFKNSDLYINRDCGKRKFNEMLEFLFFTTCCSIISAGIILYCLFFVYECVFTTYDILLKYHVLRNI